MIVLFLKFLFYLRINVELYVDIFFFVFVSIVIDIIDKINDINF